MPDTEMYVIKRNGQKETVQFDKVLERIRKASVGLTVNPTQLTQLVLAEIHDGIRTSELDEHAARIATAFITVHPDWGTLAANIIISNCQQSSPKTFSDAMALAMTITDVRGHPSPALSDHVASFISSNADALNAMIRSENDFLLDYFGFKTLEKSYLMRKDKRLIETPQYMWLRVAVGIHCSVDNKEITTALARIMETYDLMSSKAFTHATPTLFNAGTPRPQLSSCFLLAMKDDSIAGIYDTLKDCAMISKYAGGIGLHIHNIRAQGSYISGTHGISNGIVPMLRNFNATAHYVDQGGGKRKGSIAIYLEPWHADIQSFLKMKLNTGTEEERARDLFYGLWIPDLFMKRVQSGAEWSVFCPHEAPGLADVVGDEFEALYTKYEAQGLARRTLPAQKLWTEILVSQIETGTPYLLYKDAANLKSNQQNLGVIKSSNLCTEIIEYSSPDETAVCNLASIALPYFLTPDNGFDYAKLQEVVAVIVRNLNRIIDINYYPIPEARKSNMRHRPIGIGIQGLADVFARLGLSWESEGAAALNIDIFETIYYAAVQESVNLAIRDGAYETFAGSPASKGLLQQDLWKPQEAPIRDVKLSYLRNTTFDWESLRWGVKTNGLRNSLLVAPMPTASTSQILGYNECIEPFTNNIYVRRTLAGEFTVINTYLVKALIGAKLWTPTLKDQIIAANGSIQGIPEIPESIKSVYKTVWEIKQKTLIDMAAARGRYICQSQSLNLFITEPTIAKLSSMHFYAWTTGLKTGMYYLRTRTGVQAIKFTLDPSITKPVEEKTKVEGEGDGECVMCSS